MPGALENGDDDAGTISTDAVKAQNLRGIVVRCTDCEKPRCLYSPRAPQLMKPAADGDEEEPSAEAIKACREYAKEQLDIAKENPLFICGMQPLDSDNKLYGWTHCDSPTCGVMEYSAMILSSSTTTRRPQQHGVTATCALIVLAVQAMMALLTSLYLLWTGKQSCRCVSFAGTRALFPWLVIIAAGMELLVRRELPRRHQPPREAGTKCYPSSMAIKAS